MANKMGRPRKPRPLLTCKGCGQTFTMLRLRGALRMQWCSRECYRRTASHGSEHGQWQNGRFIGGNGYVYVLVPREERVGHRCSLLDGRYIAEHTLIAERVLGRCLRRGEVVHHINGDKQDNRHQNLVICTQSYHALLHQRMAAAFMREHFGSR